MRTANTTKPETNIRQKLILVISAVFLFLVLLEAALRLGGIIFLSLQEHRNRISVEQEGAYRILCLGESTTAGQYPHFLEEILNQRKIGVKFSVIDKGIPGAHTSTILYLLED